jgi:parallel beta-helix repeat protein
MSFRLLLVITTLSVLSFKTVSAQNPLFAPAVNYNVGSQPRSVFAADLDGDGNNDLAVANWNSNNVSILFNDGYGIFSQPVNYGIGGYPRSVFAADFDGDGDKDLVVANDVSPGFVSILINNGNGTYQAPANYDVGTWPHSVFAADLDSDGDIDLAVANGNSTSISILFNNGDGIFQAAVNYNVGNWPYSIFASDLDGDGDNDIAVANYSSNNVSILINNGNGIFQEAVNLSVGIGPTSVFAADLNNDGDNDLAVANASSNDISILFNNGDGTFQEPEIYDSGNIPYSVLIVDIDSDGYKDLIVANSGSNTVSVLKNTGDGIFQTAVNYNVGTEPQIVFAADLNRDGFSDLAVANKNSNNISILINRRQSLWNVSANGNDTTGNGSENNPFKTIQHAINVSSNSDTVLVAPGTYYENINFNRHSIVLGSYYLISGDTSLIENTTIDGHNLAPSVLVDSGEDTTTIVCGFKIQNGVGGGIRCLNSSIKICHNIITGNTSIAENGCGIYGEYANNLHISDCKIFGNGGGVRGGGIYIAESANSIIENNQIVGNSVLWRGGGIMILHGAGTLIKNNLISDNWTNSNYYEHSYGGGICCVGQGTIQGNVIVNNYAARGAGIGSDWASINLVINNTIWGNQYGYGIWGTYISINNIFWGNSPGQIGIYYGSISYSDIQGGWGGLGNIDSDPLFTDTAIGNFNLQANSLCIDTGDPNSQFDPDGTRADMGALSFIYQVSPFHLIEPASNSIYLLSHPQYIWSKSVDSSYQVFYKLFFDDDSTLSTPESTYILTDTSYAPVDSLTRSKYYYWKVRSFSNHYAPRYSPETGKFYLDGYPTTPIMFAPENGRIADSLTMLSWLISTDPDSFDGVSYTVQIDNDSAFTSPEVNQAGLRSGMVADDAFAICLGQLGGYESFQVDTRYFWRVRADDNYGLDSNWPDSIHWFVFMAQNHSPNPPDSGFSPVNGEEVISLTPVITWDNAFDPDRDDHPGTLSYAIRLSGDSFFTGPVYFDTSNQGINQIQSISDLNDNSHYFYQVKTIDDGGLSSGWSATQNFWTNHYNFPPEPFPLMEPLAEAKQVVANTHFTWGHTLDYDPNSSFTYSIQFSPDSLFRYDIGVHSGLTDTSITITTDSIALSGQIFWRVVAVDNDSLIRIGGIPEQVRQLIILPPGDANGSGTTTGLDVSFLVNYFKGRNSGPDPLLAGDANGSCTTTGLDVTYLVRFFKGIGSAPRRCGN